jgi:hypothetical protein
MSYTGYADKTFASIKAHDSVEKTKLIKEQKSMEIEKGQKAIKGIFSGIIYSSPVWLLIISLVIWLI